MEIWDIRKSLDLVLGARAGGLQKSPRKAVQHTTKHSTQQCWRSSEIKKSKSTHNGTTKHHNRKPWAIITIACSIFLILISPSHAPFNIGWSDGCLRCRLSYSLCFYMFPKRTSTQLEQLTEKIINIISYHKSRLYFYNVCSKDLSQLGLVIFFFGAKARSEASKRVLELHTIEVVPYSVIVCSGAMAYTSWLSRKFPTQRSSDSTHSMWEWKMIIGISFNESIFHLHGSSSSGKIVYVNSSSTPLLCVHIHLRAGEDTLDTILTVEWIAILPNATTS